MEEDNSISNEKSMMYLKLDDTISESSLIINETNNYESDEKETDKLDSNVNKATNNDLLMTSVLSDDLSDNNLATNTADPSLNQLNHNDSESSYITEDLVLLANDLITTVIINNDNLNLVSHEEEVRTSYVEEDKLEEYDATPKITFDFHNEINQEINQEKIQEKDYVFSDQDDFDPDLPPPPLKFSTLKSSITIQKIPRIKPTTPIDINTPETLTNKDETMIQTVENIPSETIETNHLTVNKVKKSNSPIVTYKKVKVTKLINQTAIFIFREEYDPSHKNKPSSKLEMTIKDKEISNESNECVILEPDELIEDPDYLRHLAMKQNGTKTTISNEYFNNIPQRATKRKQTTRLSSESENETKKFKNDTNESDSDDSNSEHPVVFIEEIEPKKKTRIENAKKIVQKSTASKRSTPNTRNKPIAKSTINKTRQTRANKALNTNNTEKIDEIKEAESIYSASVSSRRSSLSTSPLFNEATTSKTRQTRANKAIKTNGSDNSEKVNDFKAADSIYSASVSSRQSSLSSSPSIESIVFDDQKAENKKQEKTPFKSIGNAKPKKSPELFDFNKIKINLTSKKTVAQSQKQSKLTEINDKGLSVRLKQLKYDELKDANLLYKNSDDEGDETLFNKSNIYGIVKKCTVNLTRLPSDSKKAKSYK